MKSTDPSIFSPSDYRSYTASQWKVSPDLISIPPHLIITFHRSMFDTIRRRIRGRFVDWYYNRRIAVGKLGGVDFGLLHSFMGSSAASMMLEEMVASGAREVIEVGTCGGLTSSARVGDIIVAEEAFADEGTSSHYFRNMKRFAASRRMTTSLKRSLSDAGLGFKSGGIWTTDAPYRETKTKLLRYREQGALGVNMESSALFAVASYRGVEVGSLQIVSDIVDVNNWRPGFNEKRVALQSIAASNAVLDAFQA